MTDLRPATLADAQACAKILQDWLDETPWMPDLHDLEETTEFCANTLIGACETTVAGDPPQGFISVEADHTLAALYVAQQGIGIGGSLLKHAQKQRDHLDLWVFQANTDAIRFYEAHGFKETRRTAGENAEKLPDILMEWHA